MEISEVKRLLVGVFGIRLGGEEDQRGNTIALGSKMKKQIASLLIVALFAATSFAGLEGITLNEANPDPVGTSAFDTDGNGTVSGIDDEFLEFANTTGSAIDLTGWTLYVDNGGTHTLRYTFSETIPANGFLALVNDWDEGANAVPANVIDLGNGSALLGNAGDNIVLLNTGNEYASWTYNSFSPVSAGLPGGATLIESNIELGTDDGDGNGLSANPDFQETTYVTNIMPTPGAMNVNVVPEPSAFLFLNVMVLLFGWKSWATKYVSGRKTA